MDIITILDEIADTMKRGGAPLTDDQRMLLAGCLAVWLEKYAEVRAHNDLAQRREPASVHLERLAMRDDESKHLKLKCCICDFQIHRAQEIQVGEFHRCDGCDSEIQALEPLPGELYCQIGKWVSKYA